MRYLALAVAVALPSIAQAAVNDPQPTAWTMRVQPLEAVERISMPPVDVAALKAEDDRRFAETREKSLRYAANLKVDLTPETAGTWERLDDGDLLWRLRVHSKGARSLNFAFDEYWMPAGGRLFIYSLNGKHVYRPFTAEDNEAHGELWTPPVFGPETVLELTIPEAERGALKLHLALVNHDYRGFGQPNMEKSGACNIDIVCPISDPYNDQERANGVISTGGSRFCSGSLLNNTANDAKPYFMTADHCLDPPEAPSLVVFWNYYNSFCRPQGGGQSPPGDGDLSQFNTGSIFRAEHASSDFHLVELDDPPLPVFNVYFGGWDRTDLPAQFDSPIGIHHPNTDEMRISFTDMFTQSGGWPPQVPGDGSHVKVFWGPNLGVTEPGSSGSPIYTLQKRFIGQLHGGASFCGGPDLTDFYGRFSRSWTGGGTNSTRASNWLDPLNTGQIILDGRNGCIAPAAPTGTNAAATANNQITVTWNAVVGATSYNVYRAVGACPQPSYTLLAGNVAGTTYVDNGVSGGSTYAYVVRSVLTGCESVDSNCSHATATGGCTLAPAFAGATSVTQPTPGTCRLDVHWTAGTTSCTGTTLLYNVYRSTDPAFVPSPATLLQSCVDAVTYADITVVSGSTYYYIVRAEDSTANGTGACNSGNQDGNLARKSGNPDVVATFSDDIESGAGQWTVDDTGPGNPWTIVTNQSNSPVSSWFVDDPSNVTDQRIAFTAPLAIPSGSPTLSFWHRYDLESNAANTIFYDGGVLEYSLDGTTWVDILGGTGPIPANPNRFTAHPYQTTPIDDCCSNPLANRRAWSGPQLAWVETTVNMADFSGSSIRLRWRRGTDSSVTDLGWWVDDVRITRLQACSVPSQAVEPFLLDVLGGSGNTVLRPDSQPVIVAPRWRNVGTLPVTLTGAASNFTGPVGGTYDLLDDTASYGVIAVGSSESCATAGGGDCYSVSVTAAARPATHWDSTVLETVSPTGATKNWTLHIGDSFTDVAASSGFYRFIETILHKNVTGGCTATEYCPTASTSREQMAVFVLVSREAPGYAPPNCVAGSEEFADVPASSPFCRWIEELARRGVVGGCGGGNYCPAAPASREQMAVFVLRTLDGTIDPPACVAGSEMFDDVPASSPFCRWIEELARRGVVTGCGGGNYCPADDVSREQMAVFLAATFAIALYGL